MISFKQWNLLKENFNSRPLGLKNPQNLGLIRSQPGFKENMAFNMKHMDKDVGGDEDDVEMLKKKHDMGGKPGPDDDGEFDGPEDMGDEEGEEDGEEGDEEGDEDMDDELGVDGENDLDGDDEEGEEGDEEDMEKKFHKKPPVDAMPHNNSAFMRSEAFEDMDGEEDSEDDEEGDEEGEEGDEDMDDEETPCDKKEKPAFLMKKEGKMGKKCCAETPMNKKCNKCSSGMNESYLPPKKKTSGGEHDFLRSIGSQYGGNFNEKYSNGTNYAEDLLLPPAEQPLPGQPGFAPQGRVGSDNMQQVSEAIQLLHRKLSKLERAVEKLF